MTNSWQSAVGFDFSDSGSRNSSLAPWRHSRSTVPTGTVASRILDLQNLAQISMSGREVSSSVRQQEQFKTGFGRRSIARFGQPASLSTKPDEQVQIDDGHSFLGLSNPRARHAEEHAHVDGRSRWKRTAGIHAQLQPSGLDKRVQYEAISPWACLPTSRSYKSIKNSCDKGGTNPTHSYNSTTPIHESASNLRSQDTSAYGGANRAESGQKAPQDGMLEGREEIITLNKRHAGNSDEWTSIETTSTMRRQSVRDLYRSHGIERPAGLLSSDDLAFGLQETPTPGKNHASCQVCLWANDENSMYCTCEHLLPTNPDMLSSIPMTGGDGTVHSQQKVVQSKFQNLHSHVVIKYSELEPQEQSNQSLQEQTKFSTKEGKQMQEDSIKPPIELKNRLTDQFEGLPTVHIEESTLCQSYQKTPLNDNNSGYTYSRSPKPEPAPENLNGRSISPLVVTSPMPLTHSISFIPIPTALNSHHKQKIQPGQRQKVRLRRPLDVHLFSSVVLNADNEPESRDSSEYQAVHPDQLQSHSISYHRKRQRHHDDSDSGYMGGVSHHDEFDDIKHNREPCSEIRNHEHCDDGHENNHKPSGQSRVICSSAAAPHDEGQNAPALEEISHKINQHDHIVVTTMSPAATSHSCQKHLPELPTLLAHEQPSLPHTDMGHEHCCHRFDLQPIISRRSLMQANGHISENVIPLKPPMKNSQRLSAFLQQQDQNIVPLLSKRLQKHQEELKQISKLGQEQINTMPQTYCQRQVQTLAVGGSKQTVVATLKEPVEHSTNSQYQDTTREEMGKDRRLIRPVAAIQSIQEQAEEYGCPCKRIPKTDPTSNTQVQGDPHSLQAIKEEKREIHDVGIKGITIVIHLEGKKDVTLKADLSLGI